MKKELLLITICLAFFSTLKTQPGSLDKSFANNGKELISKNNEGHDVIYLPDGKILIGGSFNAISQNQFSLSRYNNNGSFDSSFNNGKINTVYINDGNGYGIISMAITSDNKIIAAGSSLNNRSVVLIKYNFNGTTDSSFGVNGIAEIDCKRICVLGKMVIDSKGKILLCGTIKRTRYDTAKACLIRIKENGFIDRNFGDSGFVTVNVAPYYDGGFNALTLQPDGKIIAVGTANYFAAPENFLAVRFFRNGKPDPSFGTNGVVVTPLNDKASEATAVAVLPNARIVVAGTSNGCIAVVKYFANGYLDYTFDANGSNILSFENEYISGVDMIIEANKKIALCGYTYSGKEVLASLDEQGVPTFNFGNEGQVVTSYSNPITHNAIALQPDGKIVVAGAALNLTNNISYISIARYFGDVQVKEKASFYNKHQKVNTIIEAEY